MKRSAYSLLLIFAMSCGGVPAAPDNGIKIQFHDKRIAEYNLLFVRDSAFVVAPTEGTAQTEGAAEVIAFSEIALVFRPGGSPGSAALYGGLAGLCIGAGIGSVPSFGTQGGGSKISILVLGLSGLLIGSTIGCNNAKHDLQFDISRSIELASVKQFARYKEQEPPELQKIK